MSLIRRVVDNAILYPRWLPSILMDLATAFLVGSIGMLALAAAWRLTR